MADEEDQKLDIEAIQDKAEELKKLEELSFDGEKYDETERDVKQFMEEIVGNTNLMRFKDEYQKIWKMLKSSYDQERRTVKAAKKVIDLIFDSAQQVKAAIRMANNEVDKIRDLKQRKDEEEKKVDSRKDERIKKEEKVVILQNEIKDLIKHNQQHHELAEEKQLKELRDQWEALTI